MPSLIACLLVNHRRPLAAHALWQQPLNLHITPTLASAIEWARADGELYAVTEKFGYNTISYNAEKVDPADMESLVSVWSEKYDGRISIYDYYLPVMGLAAIAEGIDVGNADLADKAAIISKSRVVKYVRR